MEVHEHYIGIEPFGVLIDESPELEALVAQAQELRELPFKDRLDALKRLCLDAMINAYEQWQTLPEGEEKDFYMDMVMNGHPLSDALEHAAGCCRYQGALFFVLAYEAQLGDKHFLQQAQVNPALRTVFNNILDTREEEEKEMHTVSIFRDSLQDEQYDYARHKPRIFQSAIGFPWPKDNPAERVDHSGCNHFSYHRTEGGLVLVSQKGRHVIDYKPDN